MSLKKVTITSFAFAISLSALSHDGAVGIVKERMDGMKDMGKKSKAVAKMFKGESEFSGYLVLEAADSFVIHSDSMIKQFPDTEASRTGSETEALPAVWNDWDAFAEAVQKFKANSTALQNVVLASNDQKVLREAFIKTAEDCRSCHKKFRKAKR